MQAWIIREAGGPKQFSLEEVKTPEPKKGWALIRVRAFGLNRSEWFTRIGDSPTVKFPRVLGIECVGEIVDAGGLDLLPGTKVAAIMGGMGRQFDGSYAEHTLVPHASVFPIETSLPWESLAAFPEMLQTTLGSLILGCFCWSSYAANSDFMVSWVTVYGANDNNRINAISYFRYDLTVAEYNTYGRDLIEAVVYRRYQTHNYKSNNVRPGNCYIYYTSQDSKGNIRAYLSSSDNPEQIQRDHERITRSKDQIVEQGCLPRGQGTPASSNTINQSPMVGDYTALMDNLGSGEMPRGSYNCPDAKNSVFELITLESGKYIVKHPRGKIIKVNLDKVLKPYGNDEQTILAVKKNLMDALGSVCSFSEEQKSGLFWTSKKS